MKKLSQYQDEQALDLLADLLEPISIIAGDKNFTDAMRNGKRIAAVKIAVKNHKREVMEILATMEGTPIEDYHCNVLTVPMRLLEIMNDKDLLSVFTLQAQELEQSIASGPVTGTTGEDAQ